MRKITTPELKALGKFLNITLNESDIEELLERVNDNLKSLEVLEKQGVGDGSLAGGDRSWSRPENPPHNAISIKCDVPPSNEDGLLAGMTVGVKDNIRVGHVPLECGSKIMQGYIPSRDATVIERIRSEGGRITSKTNLDEFGVGGVKNTFNGEMTNPHDRTRSPGGSSGGSAVVVADGRAHIALGTDTGGSVRGPAAYCGVFGLKPSYGLVPLTGVVENTYSLDHVGIFARELSHIKKTLEAIAGKCDKDPVSCQVASEKKYKDYNYSKTTEKNIPLDQITLGIIEDSINVNNPSEEVLSVIEKFEQTINELEKEGCKVERVSFDKFEISGAVKVAMSYSELASHWRSVGVPYRRGDSFDFDYTQLSSRIDSNNYAGEKLNAKLLARLLSGAEIMKNHNGEHYIRAKLLRNSILQSYNSLIDNFDAFILPTKLTIGRKLGEENSRSDFSATTCIGNLTGVPALAIPNGTVNGCPVSIQLLGKRLKDDELLTIASSMVDNIDNLGYISP